MRMPFYVRHFASQTRSQTGKSSPLGRCENDYVADVVSYRRRSWKAMMEGTSAVRLREGL